MPQLYRHPSDPPATDYRARSCTSPIDRLLDPAHEAWRSLTPIEWGADAYRTRFRALWTPAALVVRFDCDDDEPWWTITARDGRLWNEEVVELFVDPARTGKGYAEVEISPANVVCDLRVDSPWPSLASDPTWDWTGLRSVVSRGPAGRVVGPWTAIASLPFDAVRTLSADAAGRVPPRAGDRWHFNVFRIKRPGGPRDPERGAIYAAWSVPDGPSFHAPDKFRDLVFVESSQL